MGILKDHAIVKTLKNKELRNDPEVLDAICDVLRGLDEDIDKVGELVVGAKTDKALEELNEAVLRVENSDELEEDEDFDDVDDEEPSFVEEDEEEDEELP